MTRKPLFINANNTGYLPSECGKTLTVGEFIERLEDFEEDRPVYLRFDNGYTYGSINRYDFNRAEDVGEFLEDLDLGEEEDLEPLYINANNNGYLPSECGTTLTVEELIKRLEDFEEDRPVYLRFDNGYTYGSIRRYHFTEELGEDSE